MEKKQKKKNKKRYQSVSSLPRISTIVHLALKWILVALAEVFVRSNHCMVTGRRNRGAQPSHGDHIASR